MKLTVSNNSLLSNITEIWGHGESVQMVRTIAGKVYKVTAFQNIYSAHSFKYMAFIEVQTASEIGPVWTPAALSCQGADTVKQCLGNALEAINEERTALAV